MSSPLQFYFDFSSPYGYFAATKIDELASKYGRQVEWHPILLGVIFKTTGTAPLVNIPLKGDYSRHDLIRTARFHHIPFQLPKTFPISTHQTARAMLAIANASGKDLAVKFAKEAYKAHFVEGMNIGEVENVAEIASRIGLDGNKIVSEIGSQEIKDQLKSQVESAEKKGVFGSPYIIVDDEPFWGFDRFDQLEVLLKNGRI